MVKVGNIRVQEVLCKLTGDERLKLLRFLLSEELILLHFSKFPGYLIRVTLFVIR